LFLPRPLSSISICLFYQRAAAVDASVERRAATGCGRELITDEAAAMPSSQGSD